MELDYSFMTLSCMCYWQGKDSKPSLSQRLFFIFPSWLISSQKMTLEKDSWLWKISEDSLTSLTLEYFWGYLFLAKIQATIINKTNQSLSLNSESLRNLGQIDFLAKKWNFTQIYKPNFMASLLKLIKCSWRKVLRNSSLIGITGFCCLTPERWNWEHAYIMQTTPIFLTMAF